MHIHSACVNQDGNPAAELNGSLAKVIGSCDMMVTPIHDKDWQKWSKNLTEIGDALTQYKAKQFEDYLSRGWCRLEMFFNANIPIDKRLERHEVFDGKLRRVMKEEGRRPHLLFGTRELCLQEEEPVILRLRDDDFGKYNPGGEDARTVDPLDKDVISAYVEELYAINGKLRVCFCLCVWACLVLH
jgi:hypothetical protein